MSLVIPFIGSPIQDIVEDFIDPSSGGFNPVDVSGLNYGFDASDIDTITTDLAGTTPVTTDGDLVRYIGDLSSNSYNATQSVDSRRATYKTDGTYHWIDYSGVNDINFDLSPSYDGAVDSDNWACFGVRVTGAGNRYVIGASGDDGLELIFQNGRVRPFVGTTSGNIGGNGATDYTTIDVVVSVQWDRSAGTLKAWVNQTLEVDLTGTPADKLNGASAWLAAGFNASAAEFSGRQYCGYIYTEIPSNDDKELIEQFVADKMGVILGPSLCSPVTLNISQLPSPNDQTMALTGANNLTVETTSLGNTGLQSAIIATETFQTSTDEVKIEITLDKNTTSTTQASFSVLFLQGIGIMAGVQYSPNVGGGTLLDLDSGASLITGIGATVGYTLACYIKADGTARYAAGNGSVDDSGSLSVDATYSNASPVGMASIVNAGSTTSQEFDATCNYGSSTFELGEDAERYCNV